ncbi:MAG: hypothetical protein CMP21_03775 [Rickettsiales bacterium]|nr:hypothetical protein [Rickettsiales bacterium]|tara:strand:+ start:9326 stop:10168 length:843 start_codon:yes stop_codon:yes gene_type:complete
MALYNEYFYHKTIFKSVATFGTLFNDITVKRKTSDGNTVKELKVPLSYGPRSKFLAKIEESDKNVAITLPRISFEMSGFSYDSQRKLNSLGVRYNTTETGSEKSMYNPVPYNIGFSLNVYVEHFDEGLQIIEQIVPFFSPYLNIPSKLVYDDMGIVDDVPVLLNDVSLEESYEGQFEDKRVIMWNLSFTLKTNIFKPVKESDLIRQVETNVISTPTGDSGEVTPQEKQQAQESGSKSKSITKPGLTDQGQPTTKESESVPKEQIEADDDFGFIEDFLEGI